MPADYAVVTARPDNSKHTAALLTPALYDKSRNDELGNLFGIDHLKTKLATCELTTAEFSLHWRSR